MKLNYPLQNAHTFSVKDILTETGSDAEAGLTTAEAESRAKTHGLNIYQTAKQRSIWIIWFLQFKSPIVYLLFAAALVTFYFQNNIEAISILAVILINAIIGFLMEMQARSSMQALKEMDVIHCKVLRDGLLHEIPSENIVPGDIIVLEAGDIIPGDAHLIETNQLECDESSLTGESLPSAKNTEDLPNSTPLADQLNMVFKGTSVMNGNGKAVVTAIARETQLGKIASLVEHSKETNTPLDKKISTLSRKLIWITLFMTAVFATTGFIQGKNWLLILETSIALAVAAFPEGLPIVATVALSYGMLLMARRNAIVKKLSAVETLGSTNVILTDKTGTLTENKIYADTLSFPTGKVKLAIANNKVEFEEGTIKSDDPNFQKVKIIGAICNNAYLKSETKGRKNHLGDPLEIALLNLANATDTPAIELQEQFERIVEIPFSSETKIMGTLHKNANGNFVAAKGSLEHLLEKCTHQLAGDKIAPLQESDRKIILNESEIIAADGLRVLAFAYAEVPATDEENFLSNLIYAGMIGFIDPPRMEIKDAILQCKKAGIRIVMITGDHPLTALNIARKVGLVDESHQDVINGSELPAAEALSEEWKDKILTSSIFARTTPQQKLDIVDVYQKAGNIVAMTGDGVNDAPALKKADIGIAMGLRGTQVAKETASIVLKDDSFTSIARAVAHGREIFQNIQKFVVYLVSCNMSEIFIVTALGFLAPASTLLPLQILFLNMVTDIFPALALGLGKGDKSIMDQPPRNPKQLIISNRKWVMIGFYSAAMTLAVILAVIYCRTYVSTDPAIANNIAFYTLAFAQLFHVFNMSSPRSRVFVNEVTANKFVWIALVICTVLIGLVYFTPQMRVILGLKLLPLHIMALAVIAAAIPLVIIQTFKQVSRKFSFGDNSAIEE